MMCLMQDKHILYACSVAWPGSVVPVASIAWALQLLPLMHAFGWLPSTPRRG